MSACGYWTKGQARADDEDEDAAAEARQEQHDDGIDSINPGDERI